VLRNQIQDLNKFQNRLKQEETRSAKKMPAKTAKTEDVDMLANIPKAKDPLASSKKKVTTITSTDQLQVYLKPEFKNFT